ncbi:MAG: response regulator [Spirochaetota bacterium]
MEHVETLLARLLADWEVDAYARLEHDRSNEALRPVVVAGLTDDECDALVRSELLQRLYVQARHGRTMVVENNVSAVGDGTHVHQLGLTALAVWPLSATAGPAGCLVFGSRCVSAFSDEVLSRLEQFASLVLSYSSEKERSVLQLRRLVIQLTEAEDRERSRIAALLHDDLQQTLAGIKVHIDMAARHSDDGTYVTDRLATAVSLLEAAIERSRDLSHELNPPALRTRGLVPAIEMLAAETERIHRLAIRVVAPEETVPLSEFAKAVTYRAVQELLFNIVKHAGVDDATIEINDVNGGVEVIVRDHGHGFDVDRVLAGDSPNGLGLLSIRERLEAIGAMLQIESLPGEGSTFAIFLPAEATRAEGVLTRTAVGEAARIGPTRRSVLLVDDHAVIRQGIALLLNEEPDLQVVAEADTGSDAIELARELQPDVVVMDLTMPGMNGDEATRRILAEAPSTRIIGLSMHSEREAEDAMLAAGAVAYLPKAGPSSALVAAIRDHG